MLEKAGQLTWRKFAREVVGQVRWAGSRLKVLAFPSVRPKAKKTRTKKLCVKINLHPSTSMKIYCCPRM